MSTTASHTPCSTLVCTCRTYFVLLPYTYAVKRHVVKQNALGGGGLGVMGLIHLPATAGVAHAHGRRHAAAQCALF